ncbi:4'-phosphopantetheinyl transferase [Streptomyces sp. NPDC048434]|uniref:4'-phosphopantetheinyl transferase family protein n=1 Tax=Streptomyces sp. NPDC048434 TaxID=3365549 RepID=UPI003723013C
MIEAILPGSVCSAESVGELPAVRGLSDFPEEDALLGRTTGRRRAEFAAARGCGRRALAGLGLPPGAILRAPGGSPRWPAGVVGSITHCDGYRAAAVGLGTRVLSVGIDAEPHRPLTVGLLDVITVEWERERLAELHQSAPSVCWERLLFSAKESIYKAWYPLTGRWLDFGDALLAFHPSTDAFTARLRVPAPEAGGASLARMTGRWRVANGLALTAVTVRAGLPDHVGSS